MVSDSFDLKLAPPLETQGIFFSSVTNKDGEEEEKSQRKQFGGTKKSSLTLTCLTDFDFDFEGASQSLNPKVASNMSGR